MGSTYIVFFVPMKAQALSVFFLLVMYVHLYCEKHHDYPYYCVLPCVRYSVFRMDLQVSEDLPGHFSFGSVDARSPNNFVPTDSLPDIVISSNTSQGKVQERGTHDVTPSYTRVICVFTHLSCHVHSTVT